ncbi:MAG: GNAT family N-acetyltransferase [Gammaproteobacteria bacterium]
MPSPDIHIRHAKQADLGSINRVIEAALMTWVIPERVKRLSLPSYRYGALDLDHFEIMLAEDDRENTMGIAAWEQAFEKDIPAGNNRALLLHGIYVKPSHHRQGIGRQLFKAAEEAVCKQQHDGLLVKAQQGASGFFIAQGMHSLKVENPVLQYRNRFWKSRMTIKETTAQLPCQAFS